MTTVSETVRREAIAGYELLDAPITDLDGIVWLAATVCGVPTAVINIIDEHAQHQIASVGFDAADCARDDSMCAVVFENDEQVVVPDSRLDERFAANPFVNGEVGNVVFYASSPLVTPDGVPIGTLCVFDEVVGDLTPEAARGLELLADQVVDALELRRVARELRESNASLESFARQIGHDLRNPLTAVTGFIELAATSPELDDAPEARDALTRADAAARRMNAMIADVLDFARLGGAQPRREHLAVEPLITSVLDDLHGAISATGARVQVDASGVVVGDATLLGALLQNLVANAIKFSGASGVTPQIEIRAVTDDDGLRLTVDDNGPGIPVADRNRVFGLMERGAASDVAGFGIGLATCQRIVDAHAGRIGIDVSPLGGARLWLTVPARR